MPALGRCVEYGRWIVEVAVEAQPWCDIDQQRSVAIRLNDQLHALCVGADRFDFIAKNVRIRRVRDVTPDVAGEPQDAATPIGRRSIEISAKAEAACSGGQHHQQCFTIDKRDRECAA